MRIGVCRPPAKAASLDVGTRPVRRQGSIVTRCKGMPLLAIKHCPSRRREQRLRARIGSLHESNDLIIRSLAY